MTYLRIFLRLLDSSRSEFVLDREIVQEASICRRLRTSLATLQAYNINNHQDITEFAESVVSTLQHTTRTLPHRELASAIASSASSMASLLVAGSIFIHNKIKDKKEAKKEKKRQAYEDRYNDLKLEHTQHEEKYLQRQKTGDSQPSSRADTTERRKSQNSLRSSHSDGPTQWVDEAVRAQRT